MPNCVVAGCLTRSDSKFLLFRFPSEKRDAERRRVWVKKIGRPNWQPPNDSRLCELHFDHDDWVLLDGKKTNHLKRDAVPSIFASPSRLPRKRLAFNKRMTPCIFSPSPRKMAKRIKTLHSYSKSPSKLSFQEDDPISPCLPPNENESPSKLSFQEDDPISSCLPLNDKEIPSNIITVRTSPRHLGRAAASASPRARITTTEATSPKKRKMSPKHIPRKLAFTDSPSPRKLRKLHQHSSPSGSCSFLPTAERIAASPQKPTPKGKHPSSAKKKKPVEQRRCTCHKNHPGINNLRVKLSRAELKLKKEIKKGRQETKFGRALNKVFNDDQIQVLTGEKKIIHKWSKSTISKAFKLRFACGTTGYEELLAQGQPLPSIRTLNRRVEHLQFNSGILQEVIDNMALKVDTMKNVERDCVLVLDEMSVTENEEFDVGTGSFVGEVTLPGHTGNATHALTFMVAGLNSRWKQTVAYYFTGDSTDGRVLKDIVLQLIKACEKIKLKVRAVTSDQGSVNGALWSAFEIGCTREIVKKNLKKGIKEDTKKYIVKNSIPHPEDERRKLFFLADVPHLYKNFKGMLLSHGAISFSQEIASENGLTTHQAEVKHLIELCNYQDLKELKVGPKFKKAFLTPSHFNKMSVYEAYQVLNRQVAAALEFLVAEKGGSKDMQTTAWLLRQVHKWFEFMTSRSESLALSLKNHEKYDCAIKFLRGFIELVKTLEFGEGEQLDMSWKPVQAGMILSTTSILELQEILLKHEKYKFLLTGRLTQDCLENLFSVIRKGQRKPSCLQFKRHLKAVTVAQYIKQVSKSNYQQDDREFLGDFFERKSKEVAEKLERERKEVRDIEELIKGEYVKPDIGELNSLYNLAGYVARSVALYWKVCPECLDSIICKPGEDKLLAPYNKLMKLREYTEGSLVPVNQICFSMFQKLEQTFRQSEKLFLVVPDIRHLVEEAMIARVAGFSLLDCHKIKQKLVKRYLTCRLRIHAKFQAPTRENLDYSSKSGIIKQLLRQVNREAKAAKKAKTNRKPRASKKLKAGQKQNTGQKQNAGQKVKAAQKPKVGQKQKAGQKLKAAQKPKVGQKQKAGQKRKAGLKPNVAPKP